MECRPECVLSSECSSDKACINNKCRDPCPGLCGWKANCAVVRQIPTCNCPEDHTGDPFVACRLIQSEKSEHDVYILRLFESPITNFETCCPSEPTTAVPCDPSPCGPNSRCREINDQAVCSCLPGYIGSPPTCRPECTISSECPSDEACVNWRCVDPCPGTCGFLASCKVINHNPVCSCPPSYTGDPFFACSPIRKHFSAYFKKIFTTTPIIIPRGLYIDFVKSVILSRSFLILFSFFSFQF